jgi:hypothetical protein
MSRKGRHRYIPVFYLRQWTGDDGQVCEFSKPYDRVKPRRVHPEGTGYVDGLNTVEGLPPAEEQYLENIFFKIADDAAARALRILFTPPPWNFTAKERSGWSRFIISLMLRNPETVQKHKEVAAAIFKDALPRIEETYARERSPHDPPTYAEYAALHGPNPASRTIVRLLQTLIDNVELGRGINSMRWMVLTDLKPRFQLLTSDRPLLVTNGIGHPNGQIILPISPFHIFVATNNVQTENQFGRSGALVRQSLRSTTASPASRESMCTAPMTSNCLLYRSALGSDTLPTRLKICPLILKSPRRVLRCRAKPSASSRGAATTTLSALTEAVRRSCEIPETAFDRW